MEVEMKKKKKWIKPKVKEVKIKEKVICSGCWKTDLYACLEVLWWT
jgi:hypothetical protein